MTNLNKPVSRRTTRLTIRDRSKRRPLIVTLFPGDVLGLRLLGTRKTEMLDLEACYAMAVRQRVAADRAIKAAAKKARRLS